MWSFTVSRCRALHNVLGDGAASVYVISRAMALEVIADNSDS